MSKTPSFAAAAQYCLLCSFVWGYHVHEKAILPVLSLSAWRAFCCCCDDDDEDEEEEEEEEEEQHHDDDDGSNIARGARPYLWLSLPALHALLPLLAPAQGLERGVAFLLLAAHALFLFSGSVKARPPFSLLEKTAALLLCALEVFCVLLWPLGFSRLASRFPFAPLLLTSLVCAVGVCGCWLADALRWWRVVALFAG